MKDPTAIQLQVAAAIKVDIAGVSCEVAAARIRFAVAAAITADSRPATPKQIKFASSLGVDVHADSNKSASEKINAILSKRNAVARERLDLHEGDKVRVVGSRGSEIVSSLGRDGKVYFKGGGGNYAWPAQIVRVVKRA